MSCSIATGAAGDQNDIVIRGQAARETVAKVRRATILPAIFGGKFVRKRNHDSS
jgi:hypothetical protein